MKRRVNTVRCPNWDYGFNAAYFVICCTKNREKFFGHISNEKMCLSQTGVIADIVWYEIKNHAKQAKLDAFQVS